MGQSMQKPTRSIMRNHNSRLSARSLQRSSNQSTALQKRVSWSASKLRSGGEEGNANNLMPPQSVRTKGGELLIMSRHQGESPTIKQSNKMKVQRGSIGGENSQISPNFRQIAETGTEYGLGTWGAVNTSKHSIDASHVDVHHDITISFSKTKNNNNNIFRDEKQDKKQSLKKILEFQEDDSPCKIFKPVASPTQIDNQKYLSTQIDKISATSSILSASFKKNQTPVNSSSEQSTPKKKKRIEKDECILDSKIKQLPKNQKNRQKIQEQENGIEILDQIEYNDYDCADFKRKATEGGNKKTVRMSKKMQQLRQKIMNKASNSKEKEQILKGSIQRLSKSLRKFKQGYSLESRSRESSKERIKPVLSKVQCVDIKIDSHADIRPQNENNTKVQQKIASTKSPQQSIVEQKDTKIKSSNSKQIKVIEKLSKEGIGKTTNTSSKSNIKVNDNKKIESKESFGKNGVNPYTSQNLITQRINQNKEASLKQSRKVEKIKPKQPSFTEMVKKQHFGNNSKKKRGQIIGQDCLKYSQVEKGKHSPVNQHFFLSTCERNKFASAQQYQFFDVRSPKKPAQIQAKMNKQQISSLKQITEQLAGKNRKSKLKVTLHNQSNNSSSQEQSRRNMTYDDKSVSLDHLPANLTALNFTQLVGNYEQYMLREALNRQKEGQQWVKEAKRRHKSSQHSSKMTGVKSRLLIF